MHEIWPVGFKEPSAQPQTLLSLAIAVLSEPI